MKRGADLRRAREALGATRCQVAELSGATEKEVVEWESLYTVPRNVAGRVEYALWALKGLSALEESGLPECEWMERRGQPGGGADPDRLVAHMQACAVCRARDEYVLRSVGPMPTTGGLLARFVALGLSLQGWKKSAFLGAGVLLMLGGIGVPILLVIAVVHREVTFASAAFGLLLLLVVSGAAGGIVHHLTAPLRSGSGPVGHYASWVLTVMGYLAAVLAMLTVAVSLLPPGTLGDEVPTLSEPGTIPILLVLGVFFGLVAGWTVRSRAPAAPPNRVLSIVSHPIAILGFSVVMFMAGRLVVSLGEWNTPTSWDDALPDLVATAEANPADASAQRELAYAFVWLERWDEAVPALERAIELDPDDLDLRHDLGWVLNQRQEYERALEPLRFVVSSQSSSGRAHHNLAWSFYNLGRFDEAEGAYRDAIRLGAEGGGVHDELGWVLIELDRLDEAATRFRIAIEVEPENPWHHRSLGVALAQMDDHSDALASFQRAVSMDPDQAQFWGDIGHLAHIAGEHPRAIEAFEAALRLDPGYFDREPHRRALWEASRAGRIHGPG